MNSDVARTLAGGQKIRYWDERIATVVAPWDSESREVVIEFDAETASPKPRHYLKDFDFRLAEPV